MSKQNNGRHDPCHSVFVLGAWPHNITLIKGSCVLKGCKFQAFLGCIIVNINIPGFSHCITFWQKPIYESLAASTWWAAGENDISPSLVVLIEQPAVILMKDAGKHDMSCGKHDMSCGMSHVRFYIWCREINVGPRVGGGDVVSPWWQILCQHSTISLAWGGGRAGRISYSSKKYV